MRIEINTQPPLDKIIGGKQVSVEVADGLSLADLQVHLETCYPGFARRFDQGGDEHGTPFNFFLNRKAIRDREAATTFLKDGDRLHILVPVVGGSR